MTAPFEQNAVCGSSDAAVRAGTIERAASGTGHARSLAALGRARARSHCSEVGADALRLLGQTALFVELCEAEQRQLAAVCQQRRYKPGQVLFHEGEPGAALYLILSGQVKITRDAPNGQELILYVFGPGECLGELALLDDEPRSATAQALGPVQVLLLYRQEFLAVVERRPAAARAVMARLARMVRRVTAQLQDAFLLDVPGRIARTLLEMAERHGEETPEGIRIALPMTREEFAQMVGAARPTVSKELCAFQERGILTVDREGMLLHRPDQLRQWIDGSRLLTPVM